MDKLLSSSAFCQSERMCRFLRFAVGKSLAGEADTLKEYLLGVEVFDRKVSYDPRVDPIVRVEARRLRSKLKKYYESQGREDEIVVEFPTGGYAPKFLFKGPRSVSPENKPDASLGRGSTIAVLPFTNLSADADNEYFSDGLPEELIHGLTKVPDLRVVAWNSAVKLKGAPQDVYAIGKQLGVSTVLMGSVRHSGGRLRIVAKLIEASTGYYLWSETYDRMMEDLFAIQEEISCAIVQKLKIGLLPRSAALTTRSPYNVEAYNLYLKGRYHWNKRTGEGLKRSAEYFRKAIVLEPGFALAYAGVSDAYSLLADYGLLTPVEAMPEAKAAASKAIDLDPTLAEAYSSLAFISSHFDWNWAQAEEYYRRAMELNPGYSTAHHWFSLDYLAMLGRFEEAFAEIRIARQLDPLSTIIREGVGFLMMLSGRYDEAVAEYRETLELDPYFYKGYTSLGRVLIQRGNYEEAIGMLLKGRSLSSDIPNILGALGQAYALAGDRQTAAGLVRELEQLAKRKYVPCTCFAVIYIGMGDHDRAMGHLERGCEQRELPLTGLAVHPAYEGLRDEPRFQRLL
ncbi:MAG: tetratricopeptide repeat protein, partial [Bryobacteraceae bacterium]